MKNGGQNKIPMLGRKFGRLTVLEETEPYTWKSGEKALRYKCVCDCGATSTALGSNLRKGAVASCGCVGIIRIAALNRTHGCSSPRGNTSRLYATWKNMKSRCNNPNNSRFMYYGGRGIKVCPQWEKSFQSFYEHVGNKPLGITLDRINNDGNYEPGNVRWATWKQQANNRRNSLK